MITEEEYNMLKIYEAKLKLITINKSCYSPDPIMKMKLTGIMEKYKMSKGCPNCPSSIELYLNGYRLLVQYEEAMKKITEEKSEEIDNKDNKPENEEHKVGTGRASRRKKN